MGGGVLGRHRLNGPVINPSNPVFVFLRVRRRGELLCMRLDVTTTMRCGHHGSHGKPRTLQGAPVSPRSLFAIRRTGVSSSILRVTNSGRTTRG